MVARRIEVPADVQERVHEVSNDGRFLVCTGKDGAIYLREVEGGGTRPILGPSTFMRHPLRLSPDGSRIAFILGSRGSAQQQPELQVFRTDGTQVRVFTARELGGMPSMPSLAGWSPDGQSLLLIAGWRDENPKWILVRVADGRVQDLGSADRMSGSLKQVTLSPDGRFIAYTKPGGPGYMGNGIGVRSLDGSRDFVISATGTNPLWAPDGKRVFFTSNSRGPTDLWAVSILEGKPTGPVERVREGFDWPLGMTRDGEIFYKTVIEVRDIYTMDFDSQTGRPAAKAEKITQRYVNAGSAWSPDGKLLAYVSLRDGKEPGAGEPATLVLRTVATGQERVVTPRIPLDMNLSNPQWFPDNRSLLIQPQWGQQAGQLAKVDVLTGEVQLLPKPRRLGNSGNWYGPGATLSPDGRTLYYPARGSKPNEGDIIRCDVSGGEEKVLGTLTASRGTAISVSPDGVRLAFWVDNTLVTMPAAGGEPAAVKTGNAVRWGDINSWSPDGKRIFFVGMAKPGEPVANQQCDIWSVPVEGGEPVPLGIGLHTLWFFHIHPDGKRIVFYDEYYLPGEIWALRNLAKPGK
jgi:Tol biopolymer transport system component